MLQLASIWTRGTALAKTCQVHVPQAMFGTQQRVMVNVFALEIAWKDYRPSITTLVNASACSSGLNVNLVSSGTLRLATVDPLKNGAQFAH